MAVASSPSPDWSLAAASSNVRQFSFISTCKTLTFPSVPSSNYRLHHAATSSSACHSPILEEAFPIKLQPDSLPSTFPEARDLNEFLTQLFHDPRTEDLALHYYHKAKGRPEFRPQKSMLSHLIRYLSRSSSNWDFVLMLSNDFNEYGVLPDGSSSAKLVAHCIKSRKFKIVKALLRVFESDSEVAVLAFYTAMKGYNKLHMYSSSVAVYEQMKLAKVVPDAGCYFRIMEAYDKLGNVDRVVELFREYSSGKVPDLKPFSSRVYKVLCESLGKSGRALEALGYFREMKSKGIAVDSSIYSSLICSFASIKEVKRAEELFKEAVAQRILRDPEVFLKLVIMYVEKGLMEKTLDVVKAMRGAKVRVSDCIFCAIVNGFSKKRGHWTAIKVYQELTLQGIQPGQVTYASILNIYSRLELYPKAEKVFAEMEEKGFDRCIVAYSTMVTMYGKMGRLRDAMRLVAKMKERGCEPNVWIYNSLLDMHGRANNVRQVEKIWKEMKRRKVLPDKVSYTSVISAYNRARDFEACMRYYHEYRSQGGTIDKVMAGIMVGVCSKLSRIDELLKLLADIKTEGTPLDERLIRSAENALRDAGLYMYTTKFLQQGSEAK